MAEGKREPVSEAPWRNRIVSEGERPAAEFKAHPNNWRAHPEAQHAAMRGILGQVGWVQRVVVSARTGYILDGHLRVEEALSKGNAPVPYTSVDVTPEEEAFILATLDPIGAMAGADPAILDAVLRQVQTDDAAVQEMLAELAQEAGLYGEAKGAEVPGPQVDQAETLREKWQTERGQIWEIPSKSVAGKCHRLMCGDSTSKEDVGRLMGGAFAELVITDPPYGVEYADKNKFLNAIAPGNRIQTPIEGDHGTKEETQAMWKAAFHEMAEVMRPGAVVYCFMPQGGDQMMMMMMMAGAGIEPRHELIWVKNNHVLGRVDYAYKHEPILYAWKDGGHKFYGDFQTSILEFPKSQSSRLHPTTKPVDLVRRLVCNSSVTGGCLYDPFVGSGTTLLASEQEGRVCFAMDIYPPYCAVALQRAHDMGLEPRLTNA